MQASPNVVEDLGSTDEVKVFQDEGEEGRGEVLSEDKDNLVIDQFSDIPADLSISAGLAHSYAAAANVNGQLVISSPSGSLLMPYWSPHRFTPPPAHSGIQPLPIDPKTGQPRGLYTGGTVPSFLRHGAGTLAAQPPHHLQQHPYWSGLNGVSRRDGEHMRMLNGSSGSAGPYSQPLSLNEEPLRDCNATSLFNSRVSRRRVDKSSHIKKPLNAFMLFMKEKRPEVIAECTLKESSAINQILGKKWHGLSRDEQQKYYEMAKREKELHMQHHPTWSARDNYALHVKRRKRHKNSGPDGEKEGAKKCRARFGVSGLAQWCKPCRRKKRCIRFSESGEDLGVLSGGDDDEDDDGGAEVEKLPDDYRTKLPLHRVAHRHPDFERNRSDDDDSSPSHTPPPLGDAPVKLPHQPLPYWGAARPPPPYPPAQPLRGCTPEQTLAILDALQRASLMSRTAPQPDDGPSTDELKVYRDGEQRPDSPTGGELGGLLDDEVDDDVKEESLPPVVKGEATDATLKSSPLSPRTPPQRVGARKSAPPTKAEIASPSYDIASPFLPLLCEPRVRSAEAASADDEEHGRLLNLTTRDRTALGSPSCSSLSFADVELMSRNTDEDKLSDIFSDCDVSVTETPRDWKKQTTSAFLLSAASTTSSVTSRSSAVRSSSALLKIDSPPTVSSVVG